VQGTNALLSANSLSASTTAATIAVGSALGGLLSTFAGRNPVFILNSITFLISAEMIRRIRTVSSRQLAVGSQNTDEKEFLKVKSRRRRLSLTANRQLPTAYWSDFREGLRYVRSKDVLTAVFIVAAGWGLGNGVARALYSVFGARLGVMAVEGVVARPTDFGISVLFIAMGLGGVIGAPIARRFNSAAGASLGSRMGRSLFFDGCGLVLFSFMPHLWGASLVLIAREINFAIWWTAQQTLVMTRTEDRFAGRVFASYETLTTLMMVGAMLAAGAAADRFGIRPVAATGGAVIALSGLMWFVLQRRRNANTRVAGEII
jgi:MFS family permease